MIEQLHPELCHGFVIHIHPVRAAKLQERTPHPCQCLFRRVVVEIAQRHRDVRAMPKVRRENPRLFECAHERAYFLVVREIASLYRFFQLLGGRKSRVDKQHDDRAND